MRLRSLRWRIVLGAMLWTLGLLPIGHMLFLALTGSQRALWQFAGLFHIGLSITLLVLAVLSLAAGFAQVRSGLLPFDQLRTRLSAGCAGQETRREGSCPPEGQRPVSELNFLLEKRAKKMQSARE